MEYSDKEESLVKTEYLRLRDEDPDGGVYKKISQILKQRGYDRSPESIRKKVNRLGLPPIQEEQSLRRVIVVPDMQVPYHDEKAVSLVEQYMSDYDFDIYINLGDLLDLDQISHYNDRKPRILEGKRLEDDFRQGREILQRHRSLVGDDCEMYLLEGNHEARIQSYLDQNPEHEGMLEIPVRLQLDELDINWIRYWQHGETLTIGDATFVHGRYTNKYHAKKHCLKYMTNVFYGHCHDVQSYPVETENAEKTYLGQSLGCLCDYELQYKKGQPDNWQQAITTFFFLPDGNFNHYVSRIFDYRFIAPDGTVYEE